MERTQDFDVPAEELWEAVTDPGQMGWLGDEIALDVRPGGTGRITDDGEIREVRVDTVDGPGHRLSFRWWPEGDEDMASRVDLIVVPRPPGSRLVVRETLPVPVATARPATAQARALASAAPEPTAWDRRFVVLGLATMSPLVMAGVSSARARG